MADAAKTTSKTARKSVTHPNPGPNFGVVQVRKVGGSLSVTVPARARDALNLSEGATLTVDVEDGALTFRLAETRIRPTFKERLAAYKRDEAVTDDIQDWADAPRVGRETW